MPLKKKKLNAIFKMELDKVVLKRKWPGRAETLPRKEVEGVALADSETDSKGTAFKPLRC